MSKLNGRFIIGDFENHDKRILYQVIDTKYGKCLTFGTGSKSAQLKAITFIRMYVKRHGDINVDSFPYSLNDTPNWE